MTIYSRVTSETRSRDEDLFVIEALAGLLDEYREILRHRHNRAVDVYNETSSRDSWAWPEAKSNYNYARDELNRFDERVDTILRGVGL